MEKTKPSPFRAYLSILGDKAASSLFGFKKSRVKSWRLGLRDPRPRDAHTIIEKAGGKLGWTDIYPARAAAPAVAEEEAKA